MKQVTRVSLGSMILVLTAACLSAQVTRHAVLRSYLGVGVAEIDASRAKALNLKEVRGVEVKSVDPDSPAAKAGLKEADVVLEYNGQRIEGATQFMRLVQETPVDRQVKLEVWRNGANQTLTATIGHRGGGAWWQGDNDFTIEGPQIEWQSAPTPPTPPTPPMPPMGDLHLQIPQPNIVVTMRGGTLGIECESLGGQLAEYFGVKEGVLVRSVTKGSAAEKAGMHAGDVIVKVDGEAVTSPHEITSMSREARSKGTFPVVVVRDKKEMTLTVTVETSYRGARL